MAKRERVREAVAGPVSEAHLAEKASAGWRLVAMEWERDTETPAGPRRHEVPYGLKISEDCKHLEEDPDEQSVMIAALDLIVQDCRMSQVALELNNAGYRTRSGEAWTAAGVFDLLPRMIEAGPRIFSSPEWTVRIRRLVNVL